MASSSTVRCRVNGHPHDLVSVRDRGLAYGDGLFETIRVVNGRATLLERHLSRLGRGMSVLRLELSLPLLRSELEAAAVELGEGLLKLMVTRGEAGRGYAMPASAEPTRILQLLPPPEYPAAHRLKGVRLFPCATRLAHQPLLAGLKHLNRLEQVLARSEWQDGSHAEGLMCDMAGHPVEGTMSNLLLRLDGRWVTPDLRHCGVRGVMRDYLMDQLAAEGEPVLERSVTLDELLACDELVCCNSVFGVWPVVGLGDRKWAVGPGARRLQVFSEQVLS